MEHAYYLGAIKDFLKLRKIRYAELAEELRMTESGVKKMLNAKDISFRRVLQIADFLGVSPSQLLSAAETSSIPIVRLTEAQEKALLESRELLITFWRFVVENNDISEIAKGQNWDKSKVIKLLEKLSRLELVSKSKQRFVSTLPTIFRIDDNSSLARKLNRDWSEITLEKALDQTEKLGFHRLLTLKLRHDSYVSFVQRSNALLEEVVRIAERDTLQSNQTELRPFSAVVAIAPSGVIPKEKR